MSSENKYNKDNISKGNIINTVYDSLMIFGTDAKKAFSSPSKLIPQVLAAVCLISALVFLQFNIYLSVFLGIGFYVFSASYHFERMEREAREDAYIAIQTSKRNEVESLEGFGFEKPLEEFEMLSQYVYEWFARSERNPLRRQFRSHLEDLGYNKPETINEKDGIKMVMAKNYDKRNIAIITSGTDPNDVGTDTVMQDFDPLGPGYQAFLRNKKDIVNEVIKGANKMNNDSSEGIWLNLAGHSFGGGISMMLAVELMEKINSGELIGISGINVAVYQTTGMNTGMAARAKKLLTELKISHPEFKLNMSVHVHDYDPVPNCGVQMLGDYEGDNASINWIVRPITFWSFLAALFTLNVALFHTNHIYDQDDYVDSYNPFQVFLRRNGHVCYYNARSLEDRAYIAKRANKTTSRFMCSSVRLYSWITSYSPETWKMIRVLLIFLVVALIVASNISTIIIAPSIMALSELHFSMGYLLVAGIALYDTVYPQRNNAQVSEVATDSLESGRLTPDSAVCLSSSESEDESELDSTATLAV